MAGWVIFCQPKLIVGTLKAKLCNAVSERIISLLESLLRNWISFSQFPAHTDGLRALAREQKGRGRRLGGEVAI